jgi:hypothetical protein
LFYYLENGGPSGNHGNCVEESGSLKKHFFRIAISCRIEIKRKENLDAVDIVCHSPLSDKKIFRQNRLKLPTDASSSKLEKKGKLVLLGKSFRFNFISTFSSFPLCE